MKGETIFSGYITLSEKGKKHLKKIKENEQMAKFLKETGDFLDKQLFEGVRFE